ncbi:MAG: hypothetical protein IKN12_02515 [Selenomonadaceae bacterium]|nr:hypothetical protein [Selenomonadaceae bacterium]
MLLHKSVITIPRKKKGETFVKSVVSDEVVDVPVENLLTDIIYNIYTKKLEELK